MPEYPAVRFPFRVFPKLPADPRGVGLAPSLPLQLEMPSTGEPVAADGLLDTGASVNVLPYNLGLALGATWPTSEPSLRLSGNLASHAAHPLLVMARIASFPPGRLAFAWTRAEEIPLILGQINFFTEFNACFYRSQLFFDLRPKEA